MEAFLADLMRIAPSAGRGDYIFATVNGVSPGFVQIILKRERRVEIHRIFTREPGKGNGSAMLKALCELADRHGVELALKVIPIGRKPYPLSREQLLAWYERHGFEGTRRRMIRQPRGAPPA
jgi:GNAT superfamily N-acetyltransferase